MIGGMVLALCLSLLVHLRGSEGTRSRLECLQKSFGSPGQHSGRWVRGHIDANSSPSEEKQWIYRDDECPFEQFDYGKWCHEALRCRKSILVVGDSTMITFAKYYEKNFLIDSKYQDCEADNNSPNSFSTLESYHFHNRGRNGRITPIRFLGMCHDQCKNKLDLTFVRHDFLKGVHGDNIAPSAVCDSWWEMAPKYDIVVFSSGAHVNNMVLHPYGAKSPPSNFSANKMIESSAHLIGDELKRLIPRMKPSAQFIYMTTNGGIQNFTHDCSVKPEEVPIPIADQYSWPLIPAMQEVYVREFRKAVVPFKLLVMDMQYMMQMRRGCHNDYVHTNPATKNSPQFNTWQLLYNILIELSQHG